jgi:hypothetical protein
MNGMVKQKKIKIKMAKKSKYTRKNRISIEKQIRKFNQKNRIKKIKKKIKF